MSGELDEKIRDIGAMLGISDIPDSVTELIGSFVQPEAEAKICPNCEQNYEQTQTESTSEAVQLMEIMKRYQAAKRQAADDPNLRLLEALAPFVNAKRRRKIKNCEKILTAIKML